MGRKQLPGIYQGRDGWEVDKVVRGHRFRHSGEPSYAAAEGWLEGQLARLRVRPAGVVPTFDEAAAHYVSKHEDKVSLELDVYLLGLVNPFIKDLRLDQVDDDALKPFKVAMRKVRIDPNGKKRRPLKAKTINLALDRVRRILNLAARAWREDGKPWLPGLPPVITMLEQDDARQPQQISWKQQREHLPKLPVHLGRMALFALNSGLRSNALCNLRWEWEIRLEDHGFSVFVVPKRYVKGRKRERVLVCNSVAQSIIESVRGQHEERVFVYSHPHRKKLKYSPIASMNNTAWHNWRARCELQGFRVHDMRHTVGMRLREAGVSERTQDDILWHTRQGMTAHYSVAQVLEIRTALELITDERHANNVSLASLIRSKASVPAEAPAQRKTA